MAGGGVVFACAQLLAVQAGFAAPPGPPPPPNCNSCPGPPPPPTLLPTPQATLVPSQQTVDVHLSPTHVSRGRSTKISITAHSDVAVTISVRYRGAKKPSVSHARVGATGMLVKTWRVSKVAPLGAASVTVQIQGEEQPFTATLVVGR